MKELLSPEQNQEERINKDGLNEIFANEQFSVDPELNKIIEEQIESGRYVTVVGERQEGDNKIECFFKAPAKASKEIDEPFIRQVLLGKFLKEDGRVETRGIISANIDRQEGPLYAVMETLESSEARVGFITNAEDMELLTPIEAQNCIKVLDQLQNIDVSEIPDHVQEALRIFDGNTDNFCESLVDVLEKRVKALDTEGEDEPYHQVLNRRLGISNFKEKTIQLLDALRNVIKNEEQKKESLVHGDLAPNNLYVYDNGDVEFLDLEWAGICKNKAIGTIIDFGNLRARAWNNKEFRYALDEALLKKHQEEGREELGRAIISLGILRSHMRLAGYFENYSLEKQQKEEEMNRRESTEVDIVRAWEVAGLSFYE